MDHHDVLIVGGGNAGISLAARLLRDGVEDVAVVESQATHRYRPLLNYVGAGEATMASLERPAERVVPDGCTWIQQQVVEVDPDGPAVVTSEGRRIGCTTLVICPGTRGGLGRDAGSRGVLRGRLGRVDVRRRDGTTGVAGAAGPDGRSGAVLRPSGAGTVRRDGAQAAVHGL